MLWRCWLGSRMSIRPVKNWAVGCWHGYLSGARCRVTYGPADATATHRLFASAKSRLVLPLWYRLTWVVPDKGPLNGCVCVCVYSWHKVSESLNNGWRQREIFNRRCDSLELSSVLWHCGWVTGRASDCLSSKALFRKQWRIKPKGINWHNINWEHLLKWQ